MKKFNKFLSLMLVLAMMLSLAACGGKTETPAATEAPAAAETEAAAVTYVDPYADLREDYDALSEAVYNDVLGEFYAIYEEAKAAETVSERWALMAIAEAKLMEDALMLPTTTRGGLYAISRVAPYTYSPCLWGLDIDRYAYVLVTTMPITEEHRNEMKAQWAELAGTGEYMAWAKQYLVDNGYELKDTYNIAETSFPRTWDVLSTSRAADSEAIVNTFDCLIAYDCENVMQPALAESWEVSEDGLTYTFHIRQGVKWVDSQGRELADLTADDFVAGMQHMMDAQGGLEYLVGVAGCNIKNADAYVSGDVTDFDEVGVKAVDTYTLQFTLETPCSFFMTMLNYSVFAPMNREYYTSKGGKFGADYDASASDYTYGLTPDDIAYCGAYLVSNLTDESTLTFSANPTYWNAENVNIKTLTWLYNDGSDPLKAINDCMSGVLDGVNLNSSTIEVAKTTALPAGYESAKGADNWFDEFRYVSSTDATSYMAFYNVYHQALENVTDQACKSTKTEEDVVRGNAAMQNVHFRRAVSFAVDRGSYNAQQAGEDLRLFSLRNSYTPGNFVSLEEDVTVSINGTDTTFAAGTYYGAIMQAQIDADGVAIKVWDPEAEAGIGSGDGFDGWYNPDAAVAELATAVEELAAIGVEVSAENPIYIDLPYPSNNVTYTNKANAFKQSVDAVLGGAVIINLTECVNYDEWYNTGYYTSYGYEANYDCYDLSGWGPDYGDPQTYLDTFLGDYAGYMVKCIGIY